MSSLTSQCQMLAVRQTQRLGILEIHRQRLQYSFVCAAHGEPHDVYTS
jgi:hypothetical protein